MLSQFYNLNREIVLAVFSPGKALPSVNKVIRHHKMLCEILNIIPVIFSQAWSPAPLPGAEMLASVSAGGVLLVMLS